MLVVVNLHPTKTLRNVRVRVPADAQMFAGYSAVAEWRFRDVLGEGPEHVVRSRDLLEFGLQLEEIESVGATLWRVVAV